MGMRPEIIADLLLGIASISKQIKRPCVLLQNAISPEAFLGVEGAGNISSLKTSKRLSRLISPIQQFEFACS